jgi:16S rRNA (uracil1498-N3)-methyltransferase
MSERFYINLPLTLGPVEMTGPEARHLATVCRLGAGDEIQLFNGDGHEYQARIVETSKKSVHMEVFSAAAPTRELPFQLEIAAPIPKGDRAQFLVEKLTELGVTAFVPLLCERGVVQPGPGKMDKLERYVIEASKQCGRNILMRVKEPVSWERYCRRGEAGELRVVAHPSGADAWKDYRPVAPRATRCAVGPEGGFTDEEISLAAANGWQAVSLGPRILRIETAAVVMAARA